MLGAADSHVRLMGVTQAPRLHSLGAIIFSKMATLALLLVPLLVLLPLLFAKFLSYPSGRRTQLPLPPSPPQLPIIGHLHLLSDVPHIDLARLAAQRGPIIHLQLGHVPTLVVSSPRLAREVLRTHDQALASRPHLATAHYLSFGCPDITFAPSGPYWRQARRICVSELLSPKRVASFYRVRNEEVDRMLAVVSDRAGSEINMSEQFFALANDVLCRMAFGRRFREDQSEAGSRIAEVLAETQALLSGFNLGDFFPRWGWINSVTGLTRRLDQNLRDLRAVCDEIVKDHKVKRLRSGGDAEEGKEDFVDVLLRVQKGDVLELPITDDRLKALVLDLFVAGTDTTAATMDWTMTELARHPAALRCAQAEVRTVAGDSGRVEEEHLPQLHYLKAAIKEAHRLHPPAPLLVPRESVADAVIDGYLIPAGTRVLVNVYAIGRDPEVWTRPMAYEPERFTAAAAGGGEVKEREFALLPFGGGRRGCPGYGFALATVELALARLLYHFDWQLPTGVGPDDVDLSDRFGLANEQEGSTASSSYKELSTSIAKGVMIEDCGFLEFLGQSYVF